MFQLKIESGPINVYMFGSKPYKATTPVQGFGQNGLLHDHPDGESAWENWWIDKPGQSLKHIYFMGKDNIPFHTIIWPAILIGLNRTRDQNEQLHLEDNVA